MTDHTNPTIETFTAAGPQLARNRDGGCGHLIATGEQLHEVTEGGKRLTYCSDCLPPDVSPRR